VAKRDVATCRPDELVVAVRDRVSSEGNEPVIVIDADRIVLGLVRPGGSIGDPSLRVEDAMDPAPVTFRPNLPVGELPEYLERASPREILVTTSDGVLIGLVPVGTA
jgi:Mg/Co/Ni transporter MgtE